MALLRQCLETLRRKRGEDPIEYSPAPSAIRLQAPIARLASKPVARGMPFNDPSRSAHAASARAWQAGSERLGR